jgi:hypothetical protein
MVMFLFLAFYYIGLCQKCCTNLYRTWLHISNAQIPVGPIPFTWKLLWSFKTKSLKQSSAPNSGFDIMCFRVDWDEAMERRNCQCCYEGLQTNVHNQLSTRFHISAVITTKVQLSDKDTLLQTQSSISSKSVFTVAIRCLNTGVSSCHVHQDSRRFVRTVIQCWITAFLCRQVWRRWSARVHQNATHLTMTRKCYYHSSFNMKVKGNDKCIPGMN